MKISPIRLYVLLVLTGGYGFFNGMIHTEQRLLDKFDRVDILFQQTELRCKAYEARSKSAAERATRDAQAIGQTLDAAEAYRTRINEDLGNLPDIVRRCAENELHEKPYPQLPRRPTKL